MKIVFLTTQTTHHTYFAQQMAKAVPLEMVLIERNVLSPPFETYHPYEEDRDAYEREVFFGGRDVSLEDVSNTFEVGSVNAPEAFACLERIKPDIVLVFGTGKIAPEIIQVCPHGIINLHGGDPETYRGVDTHLWAIYHWDFAGLVTTLHHLNEKLDDGDIVLQAAIPLKPGMLLHELRRYNTEVCVQLTLTALDMYARYGKFISRPQRQRGRYYSFMPSALKEFCRARFEKYSHSLT